MMQEAYDWAVFLRCIVMSPTAHPVQLLYNVVERCFCGEPDSPGKRSAPAPPRDGERQQTTMKRLRVPHRITLHRLMYRPPYALAMYRNETLGTHYFCGARPAR